jgi:RNA polymerase sigma-70 factor (ECF subfamily)
VVTRPFDAEDLVAHAAGVRALARSLVGDDATADDVVQDAVVAALARPPIDGTPPRAWFVAVVRNLAARVRRGGVRRGRRERAAARPEATPSAADAAAAIEAHRRLVDAVASLDEPYRTAIVLRYLEGLTPTEMASRLGIPAATVSTHVHRGIAMLRARLDRDRDDWRAALLVILAPRRAAPISVVPVGGAIAMSAKTVAVAAGILLLVVAGGLAVRTATTPPGDESPPDRATATTAQAAPATEPRKAVAAKPAADADDAALPPPVDLEKCDRTRDLFGVVVRRDGTPVAGARITAVTHPWRRTSLLNSRDWDAVVEGARTRSAADGTFSLPLRRGTTATLRADADGLASAEIPDRQAGGRVRVVLDAPVRLRISVVDETNHVVAGVNLGVGASRTGDPSMTPVRAVVTGDDGVAVADGLAAGACARVEVLSDGWGDAKARKVQLAAAGETEFRMVLTSPRIVRGTVTDEATGAPIANARVGNSWTLDHAVVTGADGRYALPAPPSEPNVLRSISADADGYARSEQHLGAAAEFDFRLRCGFEASGRVVGADGRPLRGALVDVVGSVRENDDQRTSSGCGVTDADGRFRVAGLDPTMPHALVVVADGFGILRQAVTRPPDAMTVDVGDVVPPPAHVLAGRVLDAAGAPLPGVTVEIYGPRGEPGSALADNNYGANAERVTDELGRFAFADLAEGAYDVFAEVPGAPDLQQHAVVPPDGDALDVTVQAAKSNGVEVRVTDEKGDPVAGADVLAFGSDDSFLHASTDAHGSARVQIAAPRADVDVFADGLPRSFFACEQQRWSPGVATLTFVLREGDPVDGLVLDPDGKPVVRAVLRFEGPDVDDVVTADPVGRFRHVVAKRTRVHVDFEHAEDGPSPSALAGTVDVEAPAKDVVIRCARVATDRTLSVKVTTPDGSPVGGADVVVRSRAGGERRTATTDAQGVARFDGLPARPRLVTANETGAWARSTDVAATPDGRQVVVALRAAAEIRGVVVDANDAPAHATVTALVGDAVAATATASDDGRFVLHVPVEVRGPFVVEARDGGKRPRTGETEDVAPGASDVRVRLAAK